MCVMNVNGYNIQQLFPSVYSLGLFTAAVYSQGQYMQLSPWGAFGLELTGSCRPNFINAIFEGPNVVKYNTKLRQFCFFMRKMIPYEGLIFKDAE